MYGLLHETFRLETNVRMTLITMGMQLTAFVDDTIILAICERKRRDDFVNCIKVRVYVSGDCRKADLLCTERNV